MVMEIIREGLIITPTGSLEPSQGSYDVPVKLINDETYPYYTINMYVGYYVNGVIKKRKCETDSEGHYLIPGIAFLRSGIISISFLLETTDKSQGLMTNALSYEIKHAPNVVVEVPADPTWQELVKEWIQELAGAVNVDNTLTKSGMAADAKATGDAISKLSDEKANKTYVDGEIAKAQLEGAGVDTSQFVTQSDLKNINAGLTDTQITLFEQLFNNLAYTNSVVGSATANSLIASLRQSASSGGNAGDNTGGDSGEDDGEDTPTVKTYTITNSLDNATTDNNVSSVEENASYTATITPNEQYIFDSVTVTMGGVDVTSTVYSDGVINISQVTGNVIIMVITLSTKAVELYSLPQATTYDGTQTEFDTGVKLFEDADQEWSICVDVECSKTGSEHVGSVFTYSNANGTQFELSLTNWYGSIPTWYFKIAGGRTNVREGIESSTHLKAVITKPKGLVQNVTPFTIHWYFEGGTYSSNVNNILADGGFPTADSLMVASNGFKGTIHDLKIYNGILTQDEINEYLGVTE